MVKTVWKKTEKGEAEICHRKHGLAQNLRRVLILIDGCSDETTVLRKGSILPDNVPLCLRELAEQDYIRHAVVSPAIIDLKQEIISITRETLGADSEKVIAKIREAPEDKDALLKTLRRCTKIVKVAIDEKKADELLRKWIAVLGP